MKDVTPERCVMGNCPAIIEVTPDDMKCAIGASCPAVYENEENEGGYIIIGKLIAKVPEEIAKRIGPDEFAIWVPTGLVKPGDQ